MSEESNYLLEELPVREVPTPSELLGNIKEALLRSAETNIFKRLQHNHDARYCKWDGHNPLTCRKPSDDNLPHGKSAADIFPWPGAADLESKLTDEIINEYADLLKVAVRRARPDIMPKLQDTSDARKMELAKAWGGVAEHYTELTDYNHDTAYAQLADRAWESGHGILYVGWKEEKQVEKRTITSEDVIQLFAAAAVASAQQMEITIAEMEGREPAEMDEIQAKAIEAATQADWDEMLVDPALRTQLAERLLALDPDMTKNEARRLAEQLKRGGEAVYYVGKVLASLPDERNLNPGLDVFYPDDTTRIQQAAWIVTADWLTRVELRSRIATDDYDVKAVEAALAKGPSNAAGNGLLLGAQVPDWLLSRGEIGRGLVRTNDLDGPGARWLVLTVYYRATALGDVPALYKTVIADHEMDLPLKHECCEHMHGRYPFADYVRETKAKYLWDSRGVGELTFSEQDEIRLQTNARADNSTLAIAPPMEVPIGQGQKLIRPRAQFPIKQIGHQSIKKIDLSGDFRASIEVEKSAMDRSNRYWKRGLEVDPIAKTNRQECVVGDWLMAVKQAERLRFKTIQQFTTTDVKVSALNGRGADISLTAEEIKGDFSIQLEFDVGTLDAKTVESRAKLLKEYMSALDREGLIMTGPVLKLLAMSINPRWADLIVKDGAKAQEDEANDVADILNAALNGIEKPYVIGKNHAARLELLQQLVNMPALDDSGNPILDQTGQPVPGRVARIIQENPDVLALVQKRMKFESVQDQQFDNAQTGRLGVQPSQPTTRS